MIKTGNFGIDNSKVKEIVFLENQHLHSCDYFAILPAMQHSKGRFTRYDFCRMRQAYDTTYDCRSVLKHVLKCYDIFLAYTPIVSHVVGLS